MPGLMFTIVAVIVVIVLLAITALVAWKSAISYHIKVGEAKVGSAEEKAREIIDDALKTAETKKREALLEAKEENLKAKNDLDKETKERRAEIQRYEKRVLGKEETLDKKLDALEKRESKLTAKEASCMAKALTKSSFAKLWKSVSLPQNIPSRNKQIHKTPLQMNKLMQNTMQSFPIMRYVLYMALL